MFWNLLTIENTKNLRRSMLWIELAFLALLVVTLFIAMSVTSTSGANEAVSAENQAALRASMLWPGGLLQALAMANGNGIGGLLIMILVGATTAQEYTWRTMQLWLSRGVPRPTLLAAKVTAMLLPVALVVITALLAGGIVSGILTLILDGKLHLEALNLAGLLLAFLRTGYSILPYAALAFLFAIATRSTAAAIGGGLTYLLLLENLLVQGLMVMGDVPTKLSAYLPSNLASSLLSLNEASWNTHASLTAQAQNPIFLSPPAAALGIAAWTIVLIALAILIFRRQDLSE